MKSFRELQQETNDLHRNFLVTDLSTAFTFLEVAQTTRNAETRARNIQHARDAHAAVKRFLPRVAASELQRSELQQRLELLERRIAEMEHDGPHGDERGSDPNSAS